MKKLIATLSLLVTSLPTLAAGGGELMYHAHVDLGDQDSLQRGAGVFANYCQGCHAAALMRFSHVARDLEIPDKVVTEHLNLVGDKVGDPMHTAMDAGQASEWFGVTPPDLSVIARARGADWLKSYLMTFYIDASRPTGVNNLTFKDVGMPHVMWDLQGLQRPVYAEDGKHITGLELVRPGSQTEEEFEQTIEDLVNFLVYLGEPAKLERYRIGTWVMIFLFIFTVIAYKLKKEYWRDVR